MNGSFTVQATAAATDSLPSSRSPLAIFLNLGIPDNCITCNMDHYEINCIQTMSCGKTRLEEIMTQRLIIGDFIDYAES